MYYVVFRANSDRVVYKALYLLARFSIIALIEG